MILKFYRTITDSMIILITSGTLNNHISSQLTWFNMYYCITGLMAFSPKLGIWGFGRRLAKDHPIFTSIGWILASLRGSPLPLEQLDPRIPRYRLCWCSGVGVCSGLSYFNTDAGISAGCIRICSFWCGKVSKNGEFMKIPSKCCMAHFCWLKSSYKSCQTQQHEGFPFCHGWYPWFLCENLADSFCIPWSLTLTDWHHDSHGAYLGSGSVRISRGEKRTGAKNPRW